MQSDLQSSIRYEVARDILNDLIGIHMADVYAEQAKTEPDAMRLAGLESSVSQLTLERQQLRPQDTASIDRIMREGGQVVRDYRERAGRSNRWGSPLGGTTED